VLNLLQFLSRLGNPPYFHPQPQPTQNKLKSKPANSLFCRLQRLLLRGCYWRYDLCANAYGNGDGVDNCDVRAGEEGEARSRGGGGYHELWKDVMGR
jgi:hypothetical protein